MNWIVGLLAAAAPLIKLGISPQPSLPATTSSLGGFDPASKLTFEETLAHLHRGYENMQRVIQFMETKAGAVIAFSLAIFAFVAKVISWLYSETGPGMLAGKSFPLCCIYASLAVVLIVEGVLGFLCLSRAFSVVQPRGLPDEKHFTTIFPVMKDAMNSQFAQDYLSRHVTGETRGFALGEFRAQLLVVGGILHNKIACVQQAIRWLRWQGLVAVLIGVSIGCISGFGFLPKKETSPRVDRVTQNQPRSEMTGDFGLPKSF